MSTTPAGWYPDPARPGQLRYWDGVQWTEHRSSAPGAPPPFPPPPPPVAGGYVPNVYDERADLGNLLTAEQRASYAQHGLTRFPTWLAVVLHFLTFGLFTMIYQGLKFSRLPLVKQDDFRAGKGIGFMFIPVFSLYWVFRFGLGLTDRLNFQFRLRGQHPPVPRGLVLATCILQVIPYVNILAAAVFIPIVAGYWQSATNRLMDMQPAPLPLDAVPPPPPPVVAASQGHVTTSAGLHASSPRCSRCTGSSASASLVTA